MFLHKEDKIIERTCCNGVINILEKKIWPGKGTFLMFFDG